MFASVGPLPTNVLDDELLSFGGSSPKDCDGLEGTLLLFRNGAGIFPSEALWLPLPPDMYVGSIFFRSTFTTSAATTSGPASQAVS